VPEPVVAYKVKKGPEPDAHVGQLLERGMRYVDEWAQPGGVTPPAAPATAAGAAAKSAAPATAVRPAAPAAAGAAIVKPESAAVSAAASASAETVAADGKPPTAPPAGGPNPNKDEPEPA
jgi:hypothetical protein